MTQNLYMIKKKICPEQCRPVRKYKLTGKYMDVSTISSIHGKIESNQRTQK